MANPALLPRVVDDLVAAAMAYLDEAIAQSARTGRPARVALSGGTTPQSLFRRLGSSPGAIAVHRLDLWWGDERMVPYESSDSNYGVARRLWLDHPGVHPAGVHPWPVTGAPQAAARRYAEELERTMPGERPPRFDLVFLGMGPEGHTASLFPHSPALAERAWTTAVRVEATVSERLTLTLPVLNAARRVVFLVEGAGKRAIVRRLLDLPGPTPDLPASLIVPSEPAILLMDAAAAGAST